MNRDLTIIPNRLHRLAALLGLACMLALELLAVRPDWHEAFCHHHEHAAGHGCDDIPCDDDSAGCVVTHFADGIWFATGTVFLVTTALHQSQTVHCPGALPVISPDLLLPPGCGPPLD